MFLPPGQSRVSEALAPRLFSWLLDPDAVDISTSLRDHFAALVDIDFDSHITR